MFGLTVEKLVLIAALAAVLVGPARLPGYARELATFVRRFRALVDQAREDVERDLGVPLDRSVADWRTYDPRHVVREALAADAGSSTTWDREVLAEAARVRPGQRFLVTGSAAHPRRVRLNSLAAHDPRRRAAERLAPGQEPVP